MLIIITNISLQAGRNSAGVLVRTNNTMTIVIDTDALVGLANADDSHHTQALRLAEELITRQASIHILPTTLAEFALVATTKIGLARSQKAAHHVRARYALMDVQGDITDEALNLYAKQTSKENSLFDCYVMIAAKRLSADCIFSFDGGYTQNGFTLIEEFLAMHHT